MAINFTHSRWQQIQQVMDALLELPEAKYDEFLKKQCGDDHSLLSDVKRMLDLEKQAPDFLEQPAIDLVDRHLEQATTFIETELPPNLEAIGRGSKVGSYVLCEQVGRGGMGVVFRAERDQGDFDQQVAIKFLSNWKNRKTTIERFRREQQLLADLDHPNIARLLDGGLTDEGQPYLVMEFVSGKPINQYCNDQGLSISERLKLVLKIIKALSFAHSQLIVHRDIKPSNILVTENQDLKLLDFGVAKLLGDQKYSDLTVAGEQVMTPGYAAPEQLQNQAISVATDVYQLGLVLYELMTGKQAYQDKADSFMELVKIVCKDQPTLPSAAVTQETESIAAQHGPDTRSWQKELHGDLDAIVLKMLSNDPRSRYPSMDALQADILAYFDHRPITAHTQNFTYRAAKAARRHWRVLAISTAFLLLLTAYAVTVTIQSREIQNALDTSIVEKQKADSVADFMLNIFKAADPNVSGLEKITAKELLEQGQQRIEKELEVAPGIQGHMLTALGEIYYSQGNTTKSKELLIDAVKKQRLVKKGNELSLAASLTQLAIVYSTSNDFQQAEKYFAESMLLYHQFGSKNELANSIDYAELVNDYGLLFAKKGDFEKADRLINQSIDILERITDGKHVDLAVAYSNLSYLKNLLGDLKLAETFMRKAIDIHEHALGETHSYFSIYLVSYGGLLRKLEQYEAAESNFQRALTLQNALLGGSHPYVATTLMLEEDLGMKNLKIVHLHLAAVLRDAGKYSEAEAHLQEMKMMHKELSAGNHIIGYGLCGLAKLKFRMGDLIQAEQAYREAIERLDDFFEARHHLEEALTIRQNNLPTGHGLIVETESLLALLAYAQNDTITALPILQRVTKQLSNRRIYHYGGAKSLYQRVISALNVTEKTLKQT